jgi:L,D-transpeptidase YcbB
MIRLALTALSICAVLMSVPSAMAADELRERLRHRLETLHQPGELIAGGQTLFAPALLQTLYEGRNWRPIWFDDQVRPSVLQAQLIDTIELAHEHGLDPDHYHRADLIRLLAILDDNESHATDRRILVDFELLASDALLSLGHHLAFGRINPETIDPGWMIERQPDHLLPRLQQAARGSNLNLRAILASLLPEHPEYFALVERLALQRELAANGSWRELHSGPTMRPGDLDPRLSEIRQRLITLGDLEAYPLPDHHDHDGIYDQQLEAGVLAFQRRHGLETDGVIGQRTLAALNTSPQFRIDQLRANLERWRWLPRSLGEEYVLVNIAGYTMTAHSHGETVMQQRVVVGMPYRRTPVFTGNMTYLVLNPSWEVPYKLATRDQLPKILADSDYLDSMGFAVLQGWGSEERRIDPANVDWQALSARNFPYRLRQAPGPDNALGRVKFMFPNRHNVYLHDTPTRGLFAREERAFSSGCIRLEEPERLTQWLLTERASIMRPERIAEILASGRETTVRLDRPMPVHLLYWTSWVDDAGKVQYRRDIYERDGPLIRALNLPPPDSLTNSDL